MEKIQDHNQLLNLTNRPVILVKNHIITAVNEAASHLFLQAGTPIHSYLDTGAADYDRFTGGILYITLTIHNQCWGTAVTRTDEYDIFTLDQQFDSEQLRVLALAARELRGPLSELMISAQQLAESDAASHINRSLYQLLRLVGNMSDASTNRLPDFSVHDLDPFFREIMEKASALGERAGISLQYTGMADSILCPIDEQQMERAVLNMISNAIKFSLPGSEIEAELTHTGKLFRFSVSNTGSGIPNEIQSTLFSRYLREPCIEDSRHGIGLGMLLIRNTAAAHGGAVLVDHPVKDRTRVSMTFCDNRKGNTALRSPRLKFDYAGDLDHALIELSDLLPPELY